MRYKAFISYSHRADTKLSPVLQAAVQRFAKPWYAARAFRVFRDTTNLSVAPELWPAIENALNESEFLVFLASPQASKSKWVAKELTHWRQRKDPQNILIILTEGEIVWDEAIHDFDWNSTDAVPDVLSSAFASEPFYLDFRGFKSNRLSFDDEQFVDHIASIAAALHRRSKDEIFGEHIRQHRKTMKLAWSAASALLVLAIAAVIIFSP